MNHIPGALAFHRDMMLDIPLIADLITIRKSRQSIIDESLRIANLSRLNHDYRVGEQVLLEVFARNKLDARSVVFHDSLESNVTENIKS
jgi:hypothetical protein